MLCHYFFKMNETVIDGDWNGAKVVLELEVQADRGIIRKFIRQVVGKFYPARTQEKDYSVSFNFEVESIEEAREKAKEVEAAIKDAEEKFGGFLYVLDQHLVEVEYDLKDMVKKVVANGNGHRQNITIKEAV